MNSLLDSELFYLYTNDVSYLIGDFGKPLTEKENKKAVQNPLIY